MVSRWQKFVSLISVYSYMVATGQEMVREIKCFQGQARSGNSQGMSLRVRENLSLWKKSGKSEILRVQLYISTHMNHVAW